MMNQSISMIRLIESMNDQPVAFNKHYVSLGCGINGALMLSQLVYWASRTKSSDGWIYKTHQEWTLETGLTRREQDTARKTLKSLGFLIEKKQGVPCRVFFRVNHENLYKALLEYAESLDSTQLHKSAKLDAQISQTSCTDQPNKNGAFRPTKTENTTENTTDINLGADAPEENPPPKKSPKKFHVKKFLVENGVSKETAQEFIELRSKKRKTITQRALEIIFKQAGEAQLSNERVFQIIVLRGWESFRASWDWHEINDQIEQLENPAAKIRKQATPDLSQVQADMGDW